MEKKNIPKALREQVWIQSKGKVFETKCSTVWCRNTMSVFDFHAGHNIPESKGGSTTIENLVPICARCNLSMGNTYTMDEWNRLQQGGVFRCIWSCFGTKANGTASPPNLTNQNAKPPKLHGPKSELRV
uniref:HNH endonuclease 5 domain-containing protein n=1 Tax=viral metagenome TaxID=1070528 RepID=A0A6C0K1I6_9ZZZZ